MLSSPRQAKSDLVCYGSDQIEDIWPKVKKHLERGLGPDYTLQDIYVGLRKREMQLWTSQHGGYTEAALVTALHDDYCLLLCAGGENFYAWKGYLPVVEAWAKENGATEMRIYGRRGWLRALPGFKEQSVQMSKQL